ncbi:copper transporter [Corynebacterium sp. CNCTC7651]|uniref:copper transporter n=1 Tax=Corynebacterium sp. CNCTC7651 TaxID=2815361 RepID=UPI001F3DC840|nr:copper transporter [Corynebacterium sp. CNCTC7651]UIZ93099.1 copper transporter [Corynebacterium sp. CNCTC7651]
MANAGQASGLVAAGLGWGIALGVALGTLLIAPAMGGTLTDDPLTRPAAPTHSAEGGGTEAGGANSSDAEAQAEEANALLADQSQMIVEGALTDVPVTVIRTASADDADAAAVRWLANVAGASSSGGIMLTEKFFDREAADELASIIATTLPAGAQLSVENRSPGTHAGESLAAVLAADPATGDAIAPTGDRDLVLESLQHAGFIDITPPVVPAGVIILVAGPEDDDSFASQALADFAAALGANARVVVASSSNALQVEGADTVGYVGTEAGRIRAVLAAAELAGGEQ